MTDTAVAEAFTSELHPHADSGPGGGQFVSTAGASGKGKPKKAAKGIPPGSMFFNRKRGRGTGYGLPGGDKRVRALQTIVNRLGITDAHGQPLAVDGRLGPKTTTAVVHLQQRLGFKADGIVTPAFLAQIRNLRAVPMPKKAGKAAAKKTPRKAASVREAAPATAWWDIDPIGPLDEATEALIVALDVLSPNRTTEARLTGEQFNDAHKRGHDGKFIKMIDRIIGALYQHDKDGGEGGDPLAQFNRTQLRNAAKSRGITLTRGESDDSIKAKLIASIRGDSGGEPAPAKPAKAVKAAAPKAPAKKAAKAAANPHQEEIDRGERRRSAADVASEVEELAENDATPDEIRKRVASAADRRKGQPGEDELRGLASQLGTLEDVEQMRLAARAFAGEHGLTRIGDAGSHVTFDPSLHQALGSGGFKQGDRVFVVRPGYAAPREGWSADYFGEGSAVMRKAVVEEGMSPAEEAAYNAGRTTPAVPAPGPAAPIGDLLKAKPGEVTGARALAAAPTGLHTAGAITRLTKDQRDFMIQYKGTAYPQINGALRRESGVFPGHSGFDFHREAVAALDSVMERSKLRSDVVAYRGVKDGRAVFGPAWDHDLVGAGWTEHAYLSTTADSKVATDPEFFDADSGAVLKIRVPKGTGAAALSGADYESELLLQRGLQMRVLSDTGPGPDRVIEVGIENVKPRAAAGAGAPGDGSRGGSAAGTAAPADGLPGPAGAPRAAGPAGAVTPAYAPQTAARVSMLASKQAAAGMRAAGIRPGKMPRPSADIAADLGTATSRDQAHQLIAKLTAQQLRDLAKTAGVPVKSGANKTQLRNAIVYQLVGVRLTSNAINPGR